MKIKNALQQIYLIAAAVLFLVGAVLMLVNTFANQPWAFWTGLGFALVALVFYILLIIEDKKIIKKKLADSAYSDKSDNKIEHEEVQISKTETPENKSKKDKADR